MLSRTELLRRIDRITVWKRGSERAPHKPLLILYALGRLWLHLKTATGRAAHQPFLSVRRAADSAHSGAG